MDDERAVQEVGDAVRVLRDYRMALFAGGEHDECDNRRGRAGISRERVKRVLAEGGRLSEVDVLFCRTRYFLDGVVVGSEAFVNNVFTLMRGSIGGAGRTTGARGMRGADSSLYTMRDLQKDVLRC